MGDFYLGMGDFIWGWGFLFGDGDAQIGRLYGYISVQTPKLGVSTVFETIL